MVQHSLVTAPRRGWYDGIAAATVAALITSVVAVVVYRDVLNSYFYNDDFAWLFVLHEEGLWKFLFTPMGGHTRVAWNAVIALLDAVAPLDARPWFVTVLVTHALNVALLVRLVWLLTGSAVLCAIAGLAWGTCPAASESLGWYAVYGQLASTTCLLVVFGRLARLARAGSALGRRDLVIVGALLVLALLFYGLPIAVALVWPVVVALLLPDSVRGPLAIARVSAVSAVVLGLYVALQALGDGSPANFAWIKHFPWTVVETLVQLLRVGMTWLLLGAWWTPGAHSDVVSWVTLAIAVVGWAVLAYQAPPERRRTLSAFLLLAFASYALIATARGPASFVVFKQSPAVIGATMRYHYAPQLFLVVAVCVGLSVLDPRTRLGVGIAWASMLLVGQLRYGVTVDRHDASRAEIGRAFATIRDAIAEAPEGGTAYVRNAPIEAFGFLPTGNQKPPGLAALFAIVFPSDVVDGRRVRFVEYRPRLHDAARRRAGRTTELLVGQYPPDDMRP